MSNNNIEKMNDNQINKILNSSEKLFKKKSFVIEYLSTYKIISVTRHLFQVFSILAALSYLTTLIDNVFNVYFVSVTFSVIILTVLEVLKHKIFTISFAQMIRDNFSFNTGLIPVLILTILSVYLSVSGVKEYAKTQVKPYVFIDMDKSYFNNQIDSIQSRIENIRNSNDYKRIRWSTKKGNVLVLNDQGLSLIERLNKEIVLIKDQISKREAEHISNSHFERLELEKNQSFNIATITAISAVNELFYILSVLFVVYYRFRVFEERIGIDQMLREDEKQIEEIPQKEISEIISLSKYTEKEEKEIPLTGFQIRPEKTNKTDYKKKYPEVVKDINKGLSTNQLIDKYGLSKSTIHNIKRSI